MADSAPPRLLMELRTCFEGFAGIPQETRLLFSAFLGLPTLITDGLINHATYRIGRALKTGVSYDSASVHRKYDRLSRFVISTIRPERGEVMLRARMKVGEFMAPWGLWLRALAGAPLPLYEFDAESYPEFVWDTFFSATLTPPEISKISCARYRTLTPSWRSMHKSSLLGATPAIDTRGYDFFLSQTPYPARLSPGTRLLVRYHDAIPMFLPHTIHSNRFHRKSHYHPLKENARNGVFICTSEATRSNLLRMFPMAEKRAVVIHDVVSNNFFAEPARPQAAAEIIRSRLHRSTEPEPESKDMFYAWNLHNVTLRYLLMVSTIEPRKNHLRLLRAWERLRATVDSELKLVIVGMPGWHCDKTLAAFRPWQERGELFHLSEVPAAELRQLLVSAECVVCPSIAEGFDLSGVEAMLCGGVVAASDIPVHREVYGDAAQYFDRYSVGDMAEKIGALLKPECVAARQALRERGLKHALRYRHNAIVPKWEELFAGLRRGHSAPVVSGWN